MRNSVAGLKIVATLGPKKVATDLEGFILKRK